MTDRDRFQALMLEHLYGLLDSDEARELEAYLATPEGAGLRAEAEAVQAKIGRAARFSFPNVRFQPPTTTPASKPAASVTEKTIQSVWVRWAVAACLLVVVGGLGGPAAYQMIGWYAQSRETESARLAMNDRKAEVAKLESEWQVRRDQVIKEHANAVAFEKAAEAAYRDAVKNAVAALDEKALRVRLTGPERAVPGAPNAWRIDTIDKKGEPVLPPKMEVVVRDQKNAELVRETFDHPSQSPTLTMPLAAWQNVKPGSDLFLEVVAYDEQSRKSILAERVPLDRPVYVTHLVTDKPMYRPGEVVRYRSLTLDRATFLPPDHDLHLVFRLRKPDGFPIPLDESNGRLVRGTEPVLGPDGKPVRGIAAGEYKLEENLPGGEYTLEVVEKAGDRPNAERLLDRRRILVNQYTPDTLQKTLEFDHKTFGSGDTVSARIEVSRIAGGTIQSPVATSVIATLNGRPIYTQKDEPLQLVTDTTTKQARGVLTVQFPLPADLDAGRAKDKAATAYLTVTIRDGSVTEQILKPVPLVEKELRVEFFPEGGDLVAGVANRVYFQVRTPSGKPADLKGTITDGTKTFAGVATLTDADQPGVNRGLGLFGFTPEAGKNYFLKLQSPAGITEPTKDGFPLPTVKDDGVILTALDAVTEKGQPIRVRVESPRGPKALHVGAYARGLLIDHQRVELAANKPAEVRLNGDAAAGGVTRVTVFEEQPGDGARANLVPRAERLVFRGPGEALHLNATPDKSGYEPAARVGLDVGACNEKGQPVPAIVMVGVTNRSVVAMADDKTERLLPTHFLLAGDVRDPAELENADFLLTDHPQAGRSLDLLLGTQGWRRFAEQNLEPADPRNRAEVQRLLVAQGGRPLAPVDLAKLETSRVTTEFQPKLEQSAGRLILAETAVDRLRTIETAEHQARSKAAEAKRQSAEEDYDKAAAELYRFESRSDRIRGWAMPLFLLGLLGLVVGGIALAMGRAGAERRRYVLGTLAAGVVAMLVLGGVVLSHGTKVAEDAFARLQKNKPHGPNDTFGPVMVAGGPKDPEHRPMKSENVDPPPPGRNGGDMSVKRLIERERLADLARKTAGMPVPRSSEKELEDLDAERDVLSRVAKIIENNARQVPGGQAIPANATVAMPSIVREYAHDRSREVGPDGQDHAETVFWHPVLVLPENGQAHVEFQLSDDVAGYRVLVAGHTLDGRIGAVTTSIEAARPAQGGPGKPVAQK